MATRMYKVMGCEHTDEITYASWDKDHKYPERKLLHDTTKREFEIEANSMDEASLWLITYHPELYMGHAVSAMDESGDFKCSCVPSALYCDYDSTDDEYILRMEMTRLVRNVHFHEPIKVVYDDEYYDEPDEIDNSQDWDNPDVWDEDNNSFHDDEYAIEDRYDLISDKVQFDVCGEPIMI